tara:strand:- start:126 stop:494 length:369 start_codon:yes stop_codon:yes gene_type:complete
MRVEQQELPVSVKSIADILIVVTAALIILDLASLAFTLLTGHDSILGLLPFITLDGEGNLGTMFSVVLFLPTVSSFCWLVLGCVRVHRVGASGYSSALYSSFCHSTNMRPFMSGSHRHYGNS